MQKMAIQTFVLLILYPKTSRGGLVFYVTASLFRDCFVWANLEKQSELRLGFQSVCS